VEVKGRAKVQNSVDTAQEKGAHQDAEIQAEQEGADGGPASQKHPRRSDRIMIYGFHMEKAL